MWEEARSRAFLPSFSLVPTPRLTALLGHFFCLHFYSRCCWIVGAGAASVLREADFCHIQLCSTLLPTLLSPLPSRTIIMSYPEQPASPGGSSRRLTNRNTNRYSVTALFSMAAEQDVEVEDDLARGASHTHIVMLFR